MNAPAPALPLSLPHRLAYGALGLPLAMAALPLYVQVPYLYADTAGVGLALLGTLLLAARLVDALVDPLLGVWSDRGRRRQPLILLALPCLAGGLFAVLHPPATGAAPWLLGALLITGFGFSLASIAHQAWGVELGATPGERTRLVASREGFGLVGILLAGLVPTLLAAGSAPALSRFAWLYLLLLAVTAAVTLLGVPRRAATPAIPRAAGDADGGGNTALAAALAGILAEPAFRRLLAVFILNGIATALPATLFLFFVADVLDVERASGPLLALYFLSGVLCLPLWTGLAQRLGRARAWLAAMLLAALTFVAAAGLGPGDLWPFALVCLLSGAALGADLVLPAALLAELAGRAARGRRGGAYFGCWSLVGKLNLALAAGLALPLLAVLGYAPGAPAGQGTAALTVVYCLLPVAFKLLAGGLLWRWRTSLEMPS